MTEPAPARPRFTRRRVLLGAMALVLGLAVVWVVFNELSRDSAEPVVVVFGMFEQSIDGKTYNAIVGVKNRSENTIHCMGTIYSVGQEVYSSLGSPPGGPIEAPGRIYWSNSPPSAASFLIPIKPNSVMTSKCRLPEDGRRGRVEVLYSMQLQARSGVLQRVRTLLGFKTGRLSTIRRAVCDQEIQCPLVRPDGTVEPPRLLPKAER